MARDEFGIKQGLGIKEWEAFDITNLYLSNTRKIRLLMKTKEISCFGGSVSEKFVAKGVDPDGMFWYSYLVFVKYVFRRIDEWSVGKANDPLERCIWCGFVRKKWWFERWWKCYDFFFESHDIESIFSRDFVFIL